MIRITLATLLLVFTAAAAHARDEGNLYTRFEGKTVRVHVALPTDSTAAPRIDPAVLRKEFEEQLAGRKSIRFEPAASAAEADIVVDAEVTEYFWTDHDPVDMLMGVGGAAYDAATKENYARMQAAVSVTAADGRELWKKKLVATVTGNDMSEDQGPARVSADMAKTFMKEAFSKKRAAPRRP